MFYSTQGTNEISRFIQGIALGQLWSAASFVTELGELQFYRVDANGGNIAVGSVDLYFFDGQYFAKKEDVNQIIIEYGYKPFN